MSVSISPSRTLVHYMLKQGPVGAVLGEVAQQGSPQRRDSKCAPQGCQGTLGDVLQPIKEGIAVGSCTEQAGVRESSRNWSIWGAFRASQKG